MKVEVSGICTETLSVFLSGDPHMMYCFGGGVYTKLWALGAIYRLSPKWPLEAISDFLHVHFLSSLGGQNRRLGKGAFLMPPLARPGQPQHRRPLDH